ncbi:radical SAM protein [Streptomyces sp. NPDC048332]|uniref:radical SAM protein n=1 Tax=unclassified Streptomyces TaxID=2593676 RepID=UPI00342C3DEC
MRRSALTQQEAPWDLEFDWHLTNRCNFDCLYCHPHIKHVLNKRNMREPAPDLVVRRFDELGGRCLIHMSGGEPLMYPGFTELAAGLVRRHHISINTNLSHSTLVHEFRTRVSPGKVVKIAAALHVEERERLGIPTRQFVRDVCALAGDGFPVAALYILYPPLLPRAAEDLAALREGGAADVQAKVFKGVHGGRRYPEGYSDQERELVAALSGGYRFNQPYLNEKLTFRGRDCAAGRTSFKITVTGEVRRCASVPGDYGNLYDGTFRPSADSAPCPARRVLVLTQCHAYLEPQPAGGEGAHA